MNSIQTLQQQINLLEQQHKTAIKALNDKLQTKFDAIFDDCGPLQKAIADVENSTQYGMEYGSVYSWLHFDLTNFADAREYLIAYVLERFIDADFENNALTYNLGPQLIITENGHVYDQDSSKLVVSERDYEISIDDDPTGDKSIELRNQLIENWMEESGYFPGVFITDGYGNVKPVNTQKQG